MGVKALWTKNLTPTFSMWEMPPTSGDSGIWLHDHVLGWNLSMRAKTQEDAFVEALMDYQRRLKAVEDAYSSLKSRVDLFVDSFREPDERDEI